MYKSPITVNMMDDLTQFFIEQTDDEIVWKVREVIQIDIDKKELEKALLYDRNQYEKGYAIGKNDGYASGYKERDAELVRCRECKHWEEESTFCLNKDGCYGSETTADWFCADGERKEEQ